MWRADRVPLERESRTAATRHRATALVAVAFAFSWVLPLAAPLAAEPAAPLAGQTWGVEVKAGYRDSEETKLRSPFPFPLSFLPVGQDKGFLETVDQGSHFDIAVVTLFYKGAWENHLATKVKVDLIDKWDRNPTSSDREWDIDEAWIRWGPETEPGNPHEGLTAYAKLGKFPKFERQDDRHLESYGLVSTSFNRMEDIGLEIGFDLGRHFYIKSSLTQGNPVFFRDVNALAGDNGTPLLDGTTPNPNPKLKSGLPIFYDADVDEINFDNPEVGLGLGFRLNDESGRFGLDILTWAYARDLGDEVDLNGTFYGADLDIIEGPFPDGLFAPDGSQLFASTRSPMQEGRKKREYGLNAWLYAGNFSAFGQYVDAELANLPRKAYEVELAYDWEMPYLELFGRQVFSYIAPAIRYSKINPDFRAAGTYPAQSVHWEWQKIDYGLRLGLLNGLDLTLEFADNEFVLNNGAKASEDEYLATFRYNWSRER